MKSSEIRKRQIRVRKQDSAFVYFILESFEGVTSYSTIQHKEGDPDREIELVFTLDFSNEVEEILNDLKEKISVTESTI